jgi:flagellar FliL protein
MSEPSTAPEGAPRKSKKGLIIAIASTVVLAGGGGAYFAFAGKKDAAATDEPAVVVKLPAQFVALEPPFVVNFQAGSQARFLQIAVQLMTRDPALAASLDHLTPIIRNDLLLLFGNKQVDEVSSHEGKEALRAATLDAVRKIITAEGGKGDALEAVYFTSFVMQ